MIFDRLTWLLYSRKIWRGIKFGGLAVGVETAKLKSTNIISYTTRNDVLYAVALLAPSGAPLCGCFTAKTSQFQPQSGYPGCRQAEETVVMYTIIFCWLHKTTGEEAFPDYLSYNVITPACTAVCVDLAKCEPKSCAHEYNYVVNFFTGWIGSLTT